jgi:spheroidene monooxygenase
MLGAAAVLPTPALAQRCAGTVYLTIDTGWSREAEQIAAILARRGVRATLFVADEPTFRGDRTLDDSWAPFWQARAAESWTVLLQPTSARGTWSGVQPFTATNMINTGPIVALTRATMRARTFLRFWRRVPDISAVIGADPNVIFKIGIGEVPLLHQVTFSIWPDAVSMANFARGDGPHGRAIQAVRAENWFAEELYARFRIVDDWGTWGGKSPLATKDAA